MNDFNAILQKMIADAVDEKINCTAALEERMVKMHGEYLPPIQAAKLLNCNPKTVYAMLKDGRLKGTHEGSPLVLVRSMAAMAEPTPEEITFKPARRTKYQDRKYYV